MKPDSSLYLAFRRAPDRRIFANGKSSHIDPNSYLMYVESSNRGEDWSNPQLLFAHPYGGSQDPCLYITKNGTMLCASYLWVYLSDKSIENLNDPHLERSNFLFSGGYLLRSLNGGNNWEEPIYPPATPAEQSFNAFGNKISAYNRGQMCEGKNGKLYWAVSSADTYNPKRKTSNYLMVSEDQGGTWEYLSQIAKSDSIIFNETSLYETPKGDLVAFLRTGNYGDQACIARSKDGGKTFQKWKSMGFQGHPLQATRLSDNRVLLVYGYRHKPYGIRARVLNPECTDYETAQEFIIREDGGNSDLGYPWAVNIGHNRVLVTYYFNKNNMNRFIAGSILEIE
ncbi:sialidase family protein [Membranihabitans marinus]|uniref:sialidase family protein n=1 Tax=Membranihabitans marinus TaxID=1227546 RepID=UPI001F2A4613|nr:sialidase family protein [Membranihabitans marinus]